MHHEDGATVFTQRLAYLFEHRRRPDGAQWSGAEVSAELRERFGMEVSPRLVTGLRGGATANPTRETIEALATFFGVPAGYFFDDEAGAAAAAVVALQDAFAPATSARGRRAGSGRRS